METERRQFRTVSYSDPIQDSRYVNTKHNKEREPKPPNQNH